MSVVIDSKVSVSVTNEQKLAFKTWIREKYVDYTSYKSALRNDPSIDDYIRANILTEDMKTMWVESEPYVNVVSTDLRVKRIQLYRTRIIKKVKYMITKLGEFAYNEEIQEQRRVVEQRIREQAEARRHQSLMIRNYFMNELGEERFHELMNTPGVTDANYVERATDLLTIRVKISYTKKEISEQEAETLMAEECCICMDKHTMNSVVQGKCGHQIGKACFQEWASKCASHVSCPLCRTSCGSVTEYVVS
jgi:hypothetical protein